MKYKAIFFDFFGVISSEVSVNWFLKNFSQNKINEIKEKYNTPADKGEISYDQMIENLSNASKISFEQIKKDWKDGVVINREIVSKIKELKNCYKIILLSDAPKKYLRDILKEHKLENLFDGIIISGELGFTKKDKKIFKLALDKFGVDSSESLFVDDNDNNIKIAESIGIKSYIYTSCSKLEKDFKKDGIIS